MPDRKKVGDVDPKGKADFAKEIAKTKQPMPKAAPAQPAAAAPATEKRRVRDILHELADHLDPDAGRESMHVVDGKPQTVDQVVTDAVEGVNKNPTNAY